MGETGRALDGRTPMRSASNWIRRGLAALPGLHPTGLRIRLLRRPAGWLPARLQVGPASQAFRVSADAWRSHGIDVR